MLPFPGKRVERRGPGRDESGSRSIPSGLLLGLLNIRIQSLQISSNYFFEVYL